jgi:hypothetical protein
VPADHSASESIEPLEAVVVRNTTGGGKHFDVENGRQHIKRQQTGITGLQVESDCRSIQSELEKCLMT